MFRYSPLQGEHKEAERVMERATQAICSTHEPETFADADVIVRWASHLLTQARTLHKTFPGCMFTVARLGEAQAPYAMIQGTLCG